MIDTTDAAALRAALSAFFHENVVSCRPGATFTRDGQDQAAVLWYLDARAVMNRLDDVFGVAGWQTKFETAFDKAMVVCHLSCRVNGEWITKSDAGALSEQPDEGDRYKAGYSDSLKRAAVHWGIGRYLHEMPFQSHAFDKQRKRFSGSPKMPAAFTPRAAGKQGQQAQAKENAPAAPKDDGGAALSKQWRDHLEAEYGAAVTKDDYEKVNDLVRKEGKAALLPDDLAAVYAAAAACKKKAEENELIAATPLGG